MVIQRLERTRITFMEKVSTKDPSTQAGYVQAINNFENFCMEKYGKTDLVSELKESDDDTIFEILQSWINWNNSRAPRTVTNYFSRLKKYLHYRGIKLHSQDIKEELDFKNFIEEELYPLSLEDIQLIMKSLDYKHRVLFLCQLSSLMRIGEIVQLRKKHLIANGENIIVKIPASIAKFKKGRTTFFSKEASKLLRPILRKKGDEDLVLGSGESGRFSELNIEQILRRKLRKVGLDMKYESTKRYMINTHSFRAYGITKLSRHDPNLAKKLAGQKGYELLYDRMNDDEKLEIYQKCEIDLVIDPTKRQELKINSLEKENDEIQNLKKQMESMLKTVDDNKFMMKHFAQLFVNHPNEFPNNDEGFIISQVLKWIGDKELHKKAEEKLESIRVTKKS